MQAATQLKTMRKFQSYPETLVSGAGIRAIVENQLAEEIQPMVQKVLKQYGFTEIDPNEWYPDQMYPDMLKLRSQQQGAMQNFVAVGMSVIDTAIFPENIVTIEDGIRALVDIHILNKRNTAPEDIYTIIASEPGHIRLIDGTPYPHDVVYGFIYAMTRRFCPKDHSFRVERAYLNPEQPDAAGAIYDIHWMPR